MPISLSAYTYVLCCAAVAYKASRWRYAQCGLQLTSTAGDREIAGSSGGKPEASLIGDWLLARLDTPVHLALDAAGLFVCTDYVRHTQLHTDADTHAATGVCYPQTRFADHLPEFGRHLIQRDTDRWHRSLCLGSTRAWSERYASDARAQLLERGLTDTHGQPIRRLN